MKLQDNKHVVKADDVNTFVDAIERLYTDSEHWNELSSEGFKRVYELYSERVGRARIKGLMDSLNLKSTDFEFHRFRSQEEYRNHRHNEIEEYQRRELVELSHIRHDVESFEIEGYCAVCHEQTMFQVGFMYSYTNTTDGEPVPNWREHLNCARCGFITRVRLVLHLLQIVVRPNLKAQIYITEQTTPLFRWLQARFPNLTGSEYLGDSQPLGAHHDGFRNEDLSRLTFPDESFHLIISLDVLEHVSDDLAAFSECFRCLATGGTLIITVPLNLDSERNIVRARVNSDGEIEHLINPPEYHGNPIDPEQGSLCFRYFGWEVIEQLKSVGFSDVQLISAWSRDLGYLGGEQIVIVATKAAE